MNISEFLIDIYKKQAKGNLTAAEETLLDALYMDQFLYFTVKDTPNSTTYYYTFPESDFSQNITFENVIGSDNFNTYNADCPALITDKGYIYKGGTSGYQLVTQDYTPIQVTDYLLQDGNLVNTDLYLMAVE